MKNVYKNQCSNCSNNELEALGTLHCKSEGKRVISELKKEEYCAGQDTIDYNKH